MNAFANADYASCTDDLRSTSSKCVFLRANPIIWYARKQYVVSRSSDKAKYISIVSAATKLVWLHSLFIELHVSLLSALVI